MSRESAAKMISAGESVILVSVLVILTRII